MENGIFKVLQEYLIEHAKLLHRPKVTLHQFLNRELRPIPLAELIGNLSLLIKE